MEGVLVLCGNTIEQILARFVSAEIRLFRGSWPGFQTCGYTGLALAIVVVTTMAWTVGLSVLVMTGVVLTTVATFFALALVVKILTGEENLVYYHHEIAILINAALLLQFLQQPIFPYLDVLALGIGTFMVCGRIGCLMVGCCHGRPAHWGVRYGEAHAATGFSECLVGVRLFPIQIIESLWVLLVTLIGGALLLHEHRPGEILAWYTTAYGVGRFGFEFLRGDSCRPYFLGFSEAQWISLLLIGAVTWAGWLWQYDSLPWHAAATLGLVFTMITIALRRSWRTTATHQLLHPRHIQEVAETLTQCTRSAGAERVEPLREHSVRATIPIRSTSLGVQISASQLESATGRSHLYSLSHQHGNMTQETADVLVRLILQLRHAAGSSETLKGSRNVFHVLIRPLAGKEPIS